MAVILMMMMMLHVVLVLLCYTFVITLNDSCDVVVVTAFTTTTSLQQSSPQFHRYDHNVPIIRRSVSFFQRPNVAVVRTRQRRRVVTATTTTTISTTSTNSESPSSSPRPKQKLFIFGLGRVGQQVAQYHHQQPQLLVDSCGTVRNMTKATTTMMMRTTFMEKQDHVDIANRIRMIPWTGSGGNDHHDDNDIISQEIKNGTTHVLITIPPDSSNNDQWNQRYFDQLVDTIILHNIDKNHRSDWNQNFGCCDWIGIISTTGVYGNHNGQHVTEESECLVTAADQNNTTLSPSTPSSSSSQLMYISYEEAWKRRLQRQPNNITLCIFRCAGIYSDDRSALHTVYPF